jgi:uncharacterized protein
MEIVHPTNTDLQRALELQWQYKDLELSLVDSSIVALAERLGIPRVFTFDRRHFAVVRPTGFPYLELLP